MIKITYTEKSEINNRSIEKTASVETEDVVDLQFLVLMLRAAIEKPISEEKAV